MKHYFICAIILALCFTACNRNEPTDTKEGGDTTSLNQPSNPASWSPAGHIYIYETTWENSPAPDKYWAFVLNFYSKNEIVKYQTPNKDLSHHADYMHLVDSTYYEIEYPIVYYHSLAGGISNIVFKDTTTLYWSAIDVIYGIIFNR